jgi:phosphoribosyl 1,2-cyclic phosphodiesterase
MQFDVISSGSKGNATIIYSNGRAILIDFGISKRRVEQALKGYGLSFDDLEAFFITHTHSDHASDCFNAPIEKVYCSSQAIPKCEHTVLKDHLLLPFIEKTVGPFTITSLPLSHDCKNTMGFLVSDGEESLVYVTDTGFVPEKDFPYFSNRNYYIFESNHDPKMLYESKRPDYLIRRIISDKGHLSNTDCAYYLSNLIGKNTKEVVLAHLSDECNTPEVAKDTYESVMQTQLGYLPDAILKIASDVKETKGGQ